MIDHLMIIIGDSEFVKIFIAFPVIEKIISPIQGEAREGSPRASG